MKKQFNNATLHRSIISITVITMIGAGLLLMSSDVTEPTTSFELLVFIMSSVALLLAVISSAAISQQTRILRGASNKLTQAVHELDQVIVSEKQQSKILHDDLLLDEILIKTLEEHGIDEDRKIIDTLHRKIEQHKQKLQR